MPAGSKASGNLGTGKLQIIESSKNNKTAIGASSASSAPSFQRQIVGRLVIYKGSDGTKLQSLADAKRYCKQRNVPFIQSNYDFSPPPSAANTRNASSTTAVVPAAKNELEKRRSGRPKKSTDAPTNVGKKSSAKTAERQELAQDLKAIREAMETGNTAASQASTSAKRRPGRPPKNVSSAAASHNPVDVPLDDQHVVVEVSTRVSDDKKLAHARADVSAETQSSEPARPIRQRRPNQRYTDLLSETEPGRKRARTMSSNTTASESPMEAVETPKKQKLDDLVEEVVAASQRMTAPGAMTKIPVDRKYKKKNREEPENPFARYLPRPTASADLKFPKSPGRKSYPPAVVAEPIERDVSVSPVGSGEFEAPPEFVEIQETLHNLSQDDQLPPVLPAAPVQPPPPPPVSMAVASPQNLQSKASQLQTGVYATAANNDYGADMRISPQIPYSRYATSDILPDRLDLAPPERIINPVKRGRKPGTARRVIPPPTSNFYPQQHTQQHPHKRSRYSAESYGRYGDSSAPSYFTVDYRNLHEDEHHQPRGLAKMQRAAEARYRNAGESMDRQSMRPMLGGPPELEPAVGGDGSMTTDRSTNGRAPTGNADQSQQQEGEAAAAATADAPADAEKYVYLPPEVVSDHCYGKMHPTHATHVHAGGRMDNARYGGRRDDYGPPVLLRAVPRHQSRSTGYRQYDYDAYQRRTPSPPPYASQSGGYYSSHGNYDSPYPEDYQGEEHHESNGSGQHRQLGHMAMSEGDRLPANILEEDDM